MGKTALPYMVDAVLPKLFYKMKQPKPSTIGDPYGYLRYSASGDLSESVGNKLPWLRQIAS